MRFFHERGQTLNAPADLAPVVASGVRRLRSTIYFLFHHAVANEEALPTNRQGFARGKIA